MKDPCTIALELDKQLMAIHTQENIIDRDKLQDALIESIIDGMDHKTMYAYVYDSLNGNFDDYSMNELIQETEEYYPELLTDSNVVQVTYSDTPQDASWGSGTQGVVKTPISCIV